LAALAIEPTFVGKTQSGTFLLVTSPQEVRLLQPDFRRLKELNIRSVIVTAGSDDSRFDFISRFFAPSAGIDEDPVTGSAHCCLGPFWGERLGKTEMVAFQASPRGGIVHMQLKGDRVVLGGRAVTVLEGSLV
jgi:predicted PhzF superfamily epimerase YddE/YHI9